MIRTIILAACATSLAGCAIMPCAPNTCNIGQVYEQDRDPFPVGQITYGTIFGPQPEPGKVTVEK